MGSGPLNLGSHEQCAPFPLSHLPALVRQCHVFLLYSPIDGHSGWTKSWLLRTVEAGGGGGSCLYSQHPEIEQEGREFKVILDYAVSLRPFCAT